MFVEFDWTRAAMESPILLILGGCSVVALGAALERVLYFRRRQGDPDRTLLQALEHVRHGRLADAIAVCETSPHPLGAAATAVLTAFHRPQSEIEERLQIALSEQKLLLERNVGTLGTMAAVAPLIGLLGTVWGIMRAFHDMAATGSAAPSVVAAGVAEALVTTAGGLVIAVPALLLFNHFTRRLNIMLTVAENHARSVRAAAREHESGPPPGGRRIERQTTGVADAQRENRSEPVGSPAA
ncbi:MAG: MotA/TolQ/ExbB proton channel family protein [Candidatus Krumholzibacteriia bacterium]